MPYRKFEIKSIGSTLSWKVHNSKRCSALDFVLFSFSFFKKDCAAAGRERGRRSPFRRRSGDAAASKEVLRKG